MGVFFGLMIFIILIGLGTGFRRAMNEELRAISPNMVGIGVGSTSIPYAGFKANRDISLDYKDFLYLRDHMRTMTNLVALKFMEAEDERPLITYGTKSTRYYVVGATEGIEKIQSVEMLAGRYLNARDIQKGEPVCVMGEKVVSKLFDSNEEALGKMVLIEGGAFKVIGVMKIFGQMSIFSSPSYSLHVPLKYVSHNLSPETKVDIAGITVNSGVEAEEEVRDEIFSYLLRTKYVSPQDTKLVSTFGFAEIVELYAMMARGINILIWVVGMGTLLTGVVSVSNILIITVRQRQREIGVRRALGAKPKDIFRQFISESLLLIGIAGVGGLVVGLWISLGLGTLAENSEKMSDFLKNPYPGVGIVLGSLLIILVSGILAGLLPVYKALQIKAIDAIRDE